MTAPLKVGDKFKVPMTLVGPPDFGRSFAWRGYDWIVAERPRDYEYFIGVPITLLCMVIDVVTPRDLDRPEPLPLL